MRVLIQAYRDDRAMRDEADAMGESARRRRTGREGRTLREASARVRDGFWYTENFSRSLPSPPPPPGEPPCRNSIAAGVAVAVGLWGAWDDAMGRGG